MLSIETIIQEFGNIGSTLFCFVAIICLVRWLDRNVFNKGRYKND